MSKRFDLIKVLVALARRTAMHLTCIFSLLKNVCKVSRILQFHFYERDLELL